ncbi:MAG: RND family efflux transporter MFP subunit [Bacteroidetes bacterium OLB11]|nr:MAG: RND family efflux transporter MFP subunit [Bacteroidetes bacterium OLB11]
MAVQEVIQQNIVETVYASGKIYPSVERKVYAESAGTIIKILVNEGQNVQKGQILFTLKTVNSNPIFDLPLPNAGMSESKPKVQYQNVYAPITGTISNINFHEGESVAGGTQMMGAEILKIVDASEMKVVVSINENEIQKVNLNDKVSIKTEAYPNQILSGTVFKISQTNENNSLMQSNMNVMADQTTNYYVSILITDSSMNKLKIESNREQPFRAGMSATAHIQTKEHQAALTVPFASLTTREKIDSASLNISQIDDVKECVFVLEGENKVKLREVKSGISDNQNIEIINGLNKGEKVVVAPFAAINKTLQDDMKVKVVSKSVLYADKENETE